MHARQVLRSPLLRSLQTAGSLPAVPVAPPAAVPAGVAAQYLMCTPFTPPPATGTGRLSPALASFAPTSAWRSNLFTNEQLTRSGQLAPADTWATLASALGLIGTGLGAYHGYKRSNGSIGWTIGWALLGGLFPIITIPVAYAQGFGKPANGSRGRRG